ncbi:ATP-binding protein [Skermania piniformis]|uniref:histidine kinase n=1 Tax=Skermania pinensis TaxID=39122 RepID=A0ABX8SAU0_9ACTN|nr:ATP-binding protein [Skermania piniformis]QXQ14292.1 cyclic nucleotide-binding domain-containing protein [Skermania piniformis]
MPDELVCDPAELRSLFLFESLSDEQLERLCRDGCYVSVEPGLVFAEGDPATSFYVLVDGEIALRRRSGGTEIETTRTAHKGAYSGAWAAYLDQREQKYKSSMYAITESRFFVLGAGVLGELIREWFPMAVHLLEGAVIGGQRSRQIIDQRERLLALGALSAGLTHELNNPAAAAVRAVDTLRSRVAGMRHKLGLMSKGTFDHATLETMIRLQEEAAAQVGKAPKLTPMEESDREELLGEWLDDHDVTGGWDLAPTYVQAGLDVDWLERVAANLDDQPHEIFEGGLRWLYYTVETELLMNEVTDATNRISKLLGEAKQYSQMDRAPFQVVDVHELLDSTLIMLGGKLGTGIEVRKEYDRGLPSVPCYAAELNQVWTNLIDNAAQAMAGSGTLTVRTYRDNDCVVVEIGDTGPGVPPDIRDRVFEPFFTTKPVGEGTGLGLDISFRIVASKHGGDIRVESEPGDTRFIVRLPLNRDRVEDGSEVAVAEKEPNDVEQ